MKTKKEASRSVLRGRKGKMKDYITTYLREVKEICNKIDVNHINDFCHQIRELQRREGRLFIMGVGGSAANASHAVNDFRKILNIEAYSPLDNVSELTARINDDGWTTSLSGWLKVSKISSNDAILLLSVGGGSPTLSQNLTETIKLCKSKGATSMSIVSRDGGECKKQCDLHILIPALSSERITPHAEEWQGILWHLIVNAVKQQDTNEY
jgi:D-sedoheptulose 7-phosphate isomerase